MFGMLDVITEKRHKQAPILPDDTLPQNYHSNVFFRQLLQQRWYHQEVSSTLESIYSQFQGNDMKSTFAKRAL